MIIAIGKKISFEVDRRDANFDKACDSAYLYSISKFGCDESGHLNNVPHSERSRCSIIVKFISYTISGSMVGIHHIYNFEAWVDSEEEINV